MSAVAVRPSVVKSMIFLSLLSLLFCRVVVPKAHSELIPFWSLLRATPSAPASRKCARWTSELQGSNRRNVRHKPFKCRSHE
jgi:hypothetical protein